MIDMSPSMIDMSPSMQGSRRTSPLPTRYGSPDLELDPCMDPQIPDVYRFERNLVEPVSLDELYDQESHVVSPG